MKKWAALCLTLLFFFAPAVQIQAQEETGSIAIEYHGRTEENEMIPLEGVSFLLYRAGEKSEGGWELTGEFQDSGISLADKTASGRREQAKQLYDYAKKYQISGRKQKTDVNGYTLFGELEEGLYLLAQEQPVSYEGKGTFVSAPFLIDIPEEVTGAYHRVVKPKSEWKPSEQPEKPPANEQDKEEKPSEKPGGNGPVKTGDEAPLSELLVIICGAGVVIAALMRRK